MKLDDPKQMKRLMCAVENSHSALRPFRENRWEVLEQYVGAHYASGGTAEKVPMNLIELAATIYSQKLVATSPKALIVTPHQQLKAEALDYTAVLNDLIERIDLESSLQEWVLEAVFGMGVLKVGIATAGEETSETWTFEVDEPYVDPVMLEDFVFDVTAKRPSQWQFAGHRFRVPLEDAKDNKLYDSAIRSKLAATKKGSASDNGEPSTEDLTDDGEADEDEYQDFVELWEIWLPFEGKVVTIPCDGNHEKALRVEDWKGPKNGPYHLLGFNDVPGNVLPLPPAAVWRDLHQIVNVLFNKSVRQAQRAKTIIGYRGDSTEDAQRVKDAADGEMVRMDDPQGVQQFSTGAVDNNLLSFEQYAADRFNYYAGNLEAMAGLGASTGTVGQEKLLAQGASDRMNKYQRKVMRCTQKVMRDLAWYLWNDPVPPPPVNRRVPNTEVDVPIMFHNDSRVGRYFDYNITVEPYSMQMQSPQDRIQFVMQIFQQFLIPLMPQLQSEGITVNTAAFLELLCMYSNVPELKDILIFKGPGNLYQPGAVDGKPPKPANTTRTNVRVNTGSGAKPQAAPPQGPGPQQPMAYSGSPK